MIGLETRNLHLSVGGKRLLANLNVRMKAGETWIVLGANGSGKTTLLHTLAGLRRPEQGSVLLNGNPIEDFSHRQRARSIGMLFQEDEILFPGTVVDTVLASRYPWTGWSQLFGDSADDRRIANQALSDLGLDGFWRRNMTGLSGGERRRVQIAALVAQSVPIQLLDEPTNHLDLHHQVNMLDYIVRGTGKAPALRLAEQLNVMVLHDINQALRYGTHAILLYSDGTGIGGRFDDIVNKNSLEKLYQCGLQEVHHDQRTYYFPT